MREFPRTDLTLAMLLRREMGPKVSLIMLIPLGALDRGPKRSLHMLPALEIEPKRSLAMLPSLDKALSHAAVSKRSLTPLAAGAKRCDMLLGARDISSPSTRCRSGGSMMLSVGCRIKSLSLHSTAAPYVDVSVGARCQELCRKSDIGRV